jgi:hypothetical protein
MRAMRIFLGFAASSAIAGAISAGCGSSSSPSAPIDSGSGGDVTMEAMPQPEAATPETGPDVVAETGPTVCVPDATLSSIPVPDAALNEAGTATAAGCIACLNTACPMLVAECNQNCACIAAFEAFSTCIAGGGGFQTCAVSDLLNLQTTGVDASVTCALGCAISCGYTLPTGDGGHEGGGEGGGDSGGD